ncbi:MAG: hypothetical protein RL487_325 [Actinomycetota bacterium]
MRLQVDVNLPRTGPIIGNGATRTGFLGGASCAAARGLMIWDGAA